jgi:multidrug efflux pump subunit AcrB
VGAEVQKIVKETTLPPGYRFDVGGQTKELAEAFAAVLAALALNDGGEIQAPMGRAIIGGVITSTLLTLVVVPVLYSYLVRERKQQEDAAAQAAQPATPAAPSEAAAPAHGSWAGVPAE